MADRQPRTNHAGRLLIAFAACGLGLGFASITLAETLAPDEASIDGIMARLDADAYDDRETASTQIADLLNAAESTGIPVIQRTVELTLLQRAVAPDVSIEQSSRLLGQLRRRFMNSGRGALGIGFGDFTNTGAVVGRTLPGFPAHEQGLLKVGDIITHINGESLNGRFDVFGGPVTGPQWMLRRIVISHDPGEVLRLRILREGQFSDVDIPLGSFAQLGNGGGMLDSQTLNAAWQTRLQRAGLQPSDARRRLMWKVDPTVWQNHNRIRLNEHQQMLASADKAPGAIENITFALEGIRMAQADDGVRLADGWQLNRAQIRNPPAIINQLMRAQQRNDKQPMIRVAPMPVGNAPIRGEQARLINDIVLEQRKLEATSTGLSKQIADPTATPEQKDAARLQIAEIAGQLRALDTKLQKALQGVVPNPEPARP